MKPRVNNPAWVRAIQDVVDALPYQPADQLARERDHWRARHDPELATDLTLASRSAPPQLVVRPPRPEDVRRLALHPEPGLGMSR